MLVSFTGAQSSGKTTLLNRAKIDSDFRKWDFVPEVTRVVKRKGLDINELGDDMTQLFIFAEHLNNHHNKHDTVLDRCIVDGVVYTQYLATNNNVSTWVYNYGIDLMNCLIDKLDIIFYTEPDIPLVDDGERSVNIDFRKEIIKIFEQTMQHPSIQHKVVRLSGDVDTRYNKFKTTIFNHDTIR